MRPLASAIIPAHNYGRFVGRAIESVLTQTYPHVECIVVDDGSTDETPRVLAGFGNAIRVVHQSASGPAAARNAGIRVSQGAYVAFLDADDAWVPDKLRLQIELLDEHPNTGAAGCAVTFVTLNGEEIGSKTFDRTVSDPIDLPTQLRKMAIRTFWVGGSASGAVVRRDVLSEVGLWDESLRVAEDWDLWMRIAARHEIRNVPDHLVRIALHRSAAWHDADLKWRNQRRAWQTALSRWPSELAPVARRMEALMHADCGAEYAMAGQTREALRRYLRSLGQWPFRGSSWRAVAGLSLKRLQGR